MNRPLGRSGLSLPVIGWGAMPLSVPPRPTEAEALRVIAGAVEAGVAWIDTADVYCRDDGDLGHNERLLLRGLRAAGGGHVRIATKGGLRRPGGAWVEDGRPASLRRACEASLRALDTDCLWLYQLHAPDAEVPWEDQVGTLFALRDEGKLEHVGLSNVSADELERALALGPVVSVQNRLHPLDLTATEDGVLAACEAHDVAFIAYSPVGGREDRADVLAHPALVAAGAAFGVGPGTVALAWLLTLSERILLIPGASRLATLHASLSAAGLALPTGTISALDAAFGVNRPRPGAH